MRWPRVGCSAQARLSCSTLLPLTQMDQLLTGSAFEMHLPLKDKWLSCCVKPLRFPFQSLSGSAVRIKTPVFPATTLSELTSTFQSTTGGSQGQQTLHFMDFRMYSKYGMWCLNHQGLIGAVICVGSGMKVAVQNGGSFCVSEVSARLCI